MNKSDLVDAVAARTNLPQQTVLGVIESTLAVMQDALADEQEIILATFGKFTVVRRAERTGTNPNTGDAMVIPATRYARFTSGTVLRAAVRGTSPSGSRQVADPPPLPNEPTNESQTEVPAMAKKKDKKKDNKKKKKKK